MAILNWLHKKASEYRDSLQGKFDHFVSSDEDELQNDDENDQDQPLAYKQFFKREDQEFLKVNKAKSLKKKESPREDSALKQKLA